MNQLDDAYFAGVVFALYREHGLGQFNNWYTLKKDSIERSEVLDAIRFPEVRKSAENLVASYKAKIEEIEGMLTETKSA
jgi:hypothetical protein